MGGLIGSGLEGVGAKSADWQGKRWFPYGSVQVVLWKLNGEVGLVYVSSNSYAQIEYIYPR